MSAINIEDFKAGQRFEKAVLSLSGMSNSGIQSFRVQSFLGTAWARKPEKYSNSKYNATAVFWDSGAGLVYGNCEDNLSRESWRGGSLVISFEGGIALCGYYNNGCGEAGEVAFIFASGDEVTDENIISKLERA